MLKRLLICLEDPLVALRGQVGSVFLSHNVISISNRKCVLVVSFKLVSDGDARWLTLVWANLDKMGRKMSETNN